MCSFKYHAKTKNWKEIKKNNKKKECFFFLNRPALRMRVGQANAQEARVPPAELREENNHESRETVFWSHSRCCHCTTYSNDLSFGNGGGDAPHEQRAGPVEGPRPGRVVFGLLLLFLLLLGALLWLLLFFIRRAECRGMCY